MHLSHNQRAQPNRYLLYGSRIDVVHSFIRFYARTTIFRRLKWNVYLKNPISISYVKLNSEWSFWRDWYVSIPLYFVINVILLRIHHIALSSSSIASRHPMTWKSAESAGSLLCQAFVSGISIIAPSHSRFVPFSSPKTRTNFSLEFSQINTVLLQGHSVRA